MTLEKAWVKYGTICGFISAGTYILISTVGNILPDVIARLLFFAIGIFGVISVGGMFHIFKKHRNSVMLQQAVLLIIIAFTMFTLMAVVQQTIRAFWADTEMTGITKESQYIVLRTVDSVQLGMDITFDIFYSLGFLLISILMFKHPRFGKIFGILGILAILPMLVFNLYTFPYPPSDAGLIDLGPVTGLWGLAVLIQTIRSLKWMDEKPVTE
jgi:Flp pilus assembly pilin Flp